MPEQGEVGWPTLAAGWRGRTDWRPEMLICRMLPEIGWSLRSTSSRRSWPRSRRQDQGGHAETSGGPPRRRCARRKAREGRPGCWVCAAWRSGRRRVTGTWRFLRLNRVWSHRNSYRSQFCHMYERLTRDQVGLSNQPDGGEGE